MVGAGMVEIPAGRFRMGSVGFYPEEGPGSARSRWFRDRPLDGYGRGVCPVCWGDQVIVEAQVLALIGVRVRLFLSGHLDHPQALPWTEIHCTGIVSKTTFLTHLKPRLPAEESGVLELLAATL
jgi:hypothetical protein